jgi:PAS domain S-box-containing protein
MSEVTVLATRAMAAAGDAIVTVDPTGTITSWNGAAERLFGYGSDDAAGKTLALIIPAQYRARHMATFHAAMDSGKLAHGGAVAGVVAATASGGSLVLGLSLGLLRDDPQDRPAGVVAVPRPLTTDVLGFVPQEQP